VSKRKKKKPKKPRSIEALTAILHCKGQPFKDRRTKRDGEKTNWENDGYV
jgi:hypothetical protein